MARNSSLGVAALTALCVFATTVGAAPINPTNVRPVAINDPSPALGEPGLGSLIDQIFLRPPGTTDSFAEQQSAGMWTFAAFPPSMIPTLAFEYAGGAPNQVFGIWFGIETTSLFHYDIFTGLATGDNNGDPTAAGVQVSGNTLTVFGADCVKVNCTPAGGVANGLIGTTFGFYLRSGVGGSLWYTADQLNAGAAQALAFQDGATTNWALAFEDVRLAASDRDYNDAVIKIESLNAVPEPGSMMLLGTGLLGLGSALRRRLRKHNSVA